ncbi:MAG: hypothetical protein IJ870_06555 [Alphaproteobacteria bacterium]|nr:hypothetical protein [Alphaproteobacteria bacterium]
MADDNFEKTSAKLDELSRSIEALKAVLEVKKTAVCQQKEAYKGNMAQKNARVDELKSALEMTIQKLDTATRKIDEVISENGSGNNSN